MKILMTEGLLNIGNDGQKEYIFSKAAVSAAGLFELSEEVAALPIGKSMEFSDYEGRWYEIKKVQVFHEANGILAVKTREGTKTFRIRDNTAAECAYLLMRAVGPHIEDVPLIMKKEFSINEISLKKFNCRNFCREDYEELVQAESGEGNIYIGKVSIGDVLIKLKADGGGVILAQFLVLDEEALYDQTEDGRPYDNAHVMLLEYSHGMAYEKFIKMAKQSFVEYINNYRCRLYKMSEKILHHKGERVYIDGEIDIEGRMMMVRSAATILEDESFTDSELLCCIDELGDGVSRQCIVPINRIASPFISGYFTKVKKAL